MGGIRLEYELPAPPDRVWPLLTDRAHLAVWFMETDFVAEPGRRFMLWPGQLPGVAGPISAVVLTIQPPNRLVMGWQGPHSQSTMTWTLQDTGGGTRLRVVEWGHVDADEVVREQTLTRLFDGGLRRYLAAGSVLPVVAASTPTTPVTPPVAAVPGVAAIPGVAAAPSAAAASASPPAAARPLAATMPPPAATPAAAITPGPAVIPGPAVTPGPTVIPGPAVTLGPAVTPGAAAIPGGAGAAAIPSAAAISGGAGAAAMPPAVSAAPAAAVPLAVGSAAAGVTKPPPDAAAAPSSGHTSHRARSRWGRGVLAAVVIVALVLALVAVWLLWPPVPAGSGQPPGQSGLGGSPGTGTTGQAPVDPGGSEGSAGGSSAGPGDPSFGPAPAAAHLTASSRVTGTFTYTVTVILVNDGGVAGDWVSVAAVLAAGNLVVSAVGTDVSEVPKGQGLHCFYPTAPVASVASGGSYRFQFRIAVGVGGAMTGSPVKSVQVDSPVC